MRTALLVMGLAVATLPSVAFAQASSGTGSTPTQAVTSSEAKPPLPNRINEFLPDWLRVRGEARERAEGFDNLGFARGSDDLYYLTRLRLGATIIPSRFVSFQLQVQDAWVGRKTVGPVAPPLKMAFDVRQAFADIGPAGTPVSIRVGRQELAFGDERLLGTANWNAGRAFDAVRVTTRSPRLRLDVFAASVVRLLDGAMDQSGNGNGVFGVYATTSPVLGATLEPFAFLRHERRVGSETGEVGALDRITVGARAVGGLPAALDYDVTLARQAGAFAGDDVRAWAAHLRLRRTLARRWSPHLIGEYTYASGDAEPTDGVHGTFDPEYASPHDKLGLADQVSWRNVHHVRVGVDVMPWKGTPLAVNYHTFWLAERRDGLYGANGSVLARVGSGAAHRHIGHEIDVLMSRTLTPYLTLAGGYSHLTSGGFLRESTPGASYSGPHMMLTYVFLADR